MALEDLTGPDKGIDDLVILNPDGLDPRSEGDNHIRGVKNVLVNTFGAMPVASVSLPVVGNVLTWDGAKYVPGAGIPTGTVIDFAGLHAQLPAGYLVCDGAAVSRTTYAALFAAIGVVWGVGDNSTTFNVPMLARRTTIGWGGSSQFPPATAVGSVGGTEGHPLSVAEMPSHSHGGATAVQSTPLWGNFTGSVNIQIAGGTNHDGQGSHAHAISAEGGSGQHNNIQPSAVMLKIIKT